MKFFMLMVSAFLVSLSAFASTVHRIAEDKATAIYQSFSATEITMDNSPVVSRFALKKVNCQLASDLSGGEASCVVFDHGREIVISHDLAQPIVFALIDADVEMDVIPGFVRLNMQDLECSMFSFFDGSSVQCQYSR